MTKKILLTILFLIIASIATFFIWQYVKDKRDTSLLKTFLLPRAELSIAEIRSLTTEKAKNIAYKFAIEDHEWIEGVMPGVTDIKEQSVTELQIPLRLSFKEVSRTLFDLLKEGKNVTYKLELWFRIDSESHSVVNSKVILESSGSVKSLMKAV